MAAIYFSILALVSLCAATHYKVTDRIYFDVAEGERSLGRIVIGLFGELAPKTADNFKRIALVGVDGRTYVGTDFHRIVKRFMIQGGDVVFNNGSGSTSSFGGEFEDENLETEFKVSGLIAMANRGRDSNGCQFFITTVPAPWLNGLHTAFGKVTGGQGVVHAVERVSTDYKDRPVRKVHIADCGEVPTPSPFYVSDEPYDAWAWLKAAFVPLSMSFSILAVFHWMIRKMEV